MDPKQFGAFLCEERKAKNLTQKELAEKLGVTDKAISKWERGVCLPDVAKFDDIAAALDITDVEVLRAKRLPPKEAKAEEKAPPFVTWRELGTLALAWLAITTLLFIPDILEMRGLVRGIGLYVLSSPLLTAAFAVWYALRRTRDTKRVDWRGVCIYALVCAVLFLLFVIGYDQIIYLWFEGVSELFGVTRHAAGSGNWYDSINAQIPPWTPRWVLYWFLSLRFFDIGPFYGFVAAYTVYPVTKLLRIWRNAKRQTNG